MVEHRKGSLAVSSSRLIAGFSPPHHLLLVFAFPAYAIFIVLVKPRLFLQPKKILALIGCFLLGLSVFLYYPLRSPSAPFGPTDITSPQAFIDFVSAEGLRVNLFHFGLGDQLTRFRVFFELLKLQYSIIGILLVIPGVIWLARQRGSRLSCARCSSCRCISSSSTPCKM